MPWTDLQYTRQTEAHGPVHQEYCLDLDHLTSTTMDAIQDFVEGITLLK